MSKKTNLMSKAAVLMAVAALAVPATGRADCETTYKKLVSKKRSLSIASIAGGLSSTAAGGFGAYLGVLLGATMTNEYLVYGSLAGGIILVGGGTAAEVKGIIDMVKASNATKVLNLIQQSKTGVYGSTMEGYVERLNRDLEKSGSTERVNADQVAEIIGASNEKDLYCQVIPPETEKDKEKTVIFAFRALDEQVRTELGVPLRGEKPEEDDQE